MYSQQVILAELLFLFYSNFRLTVHYPLLKLLFSVYYIFHCIPLKVQTNYVVFIYLFILLLSTITWLSYNLGFITCYLWEKDSSTGKFHFIKNRLWCYLIWELRTKLSHKIAPFGYLERERVLGHGHVMSCSVSVPAELEGNERWLQALLHGLRRFTHHTHTHCWSGL